MTLEKAKEEFFDCGESLSYYVNEDDTEEEVRREIEDEIKTQKEYGEKYAVEYSNGNKRKMLIDSIVSDWKEKKQLLLNSQEKLDELLKENREVFANYFEALYENDEAFTDHIFDVLNLL